MFEKKYYDNENDGERKVGGVMANGRTASDNDAVHDNSTAADNSAAYDNGAVTDKNEVHGTGWRPIVQHTITV